MFKTLIKFIAAVVLAVCLPVMATAQKNAQPLTNADVLEMLKAQLPESTIVLAIEQATGNFDTTPQALILLKKQGATQKILDAVLKAKATGSNTGGVRTPKTNVQEPENFGVFFFLDASGSLKQLERINGRASASSREFGSFEIKGANSPVRIAPDQNHRFVIRLANGIDPGKIEMLRFYLKEGKRMINFTISGNRAVPIEAKSPTSSGKFPFNITKFGESSYQLAPPQALSAGEYCFSTPNEASTEVFCFGVDGNSTTAAGGNVGAGDDEFESIGNVVLVDDGKRTEMKYSLTNMSSGGTILGAKVKAILTGSRAQLRVSNTSPEFLVRVPGNLNPSDYVALVKLDAKSDRREVEIGKASVGILSVKSKSGFSKNSIVPITLEEITGKESGGFKFYRVKTASPVSANEYALVIQGAQFFDFGVDTN
ncbi:MAG: hypothetical protein M3384_13465 [Acidobacteriota bacterium]|nr:hypothetical protein [Acidobacteriota bacterium]